MTYSMKCTCGHVIKVEAATREEAVAKMKTEMTQEALDKHFAEYHKEGEMKPTLEQSHAGIDSMLQEGDQEETVAQAAA